MNKNERLAFLLRKTISDAVSDEVKSERGDIFAALMELYSEHGSKQVVVKLPDGEAVANLTISQPKPKTQFTDMDATFAWVEENDPDAIEEVTVRRISKAKLAELEKHTEVVDGQHFTADGEAVPGMETTTPEPSSFTVTYAGGEAGRARLIQAWKQGELAGIDTGKTVPALDWQGHPQTEQERAA